MQRRQLLLLLLRPVHSRAWIIGVWLCVAGLIAFAFVWNGRLPGETILVALAAKDLRVQAHDWTVDFVKVREAIRLQIVFWSALIALTLSWRWSRENRLKEYCRSHIFCWSIAAACSTSLFVLLVRCSQERLFYPIRDLMTAPGTVPIFGHRLLWVWLADGLKLAHPSLNFHQAYLLSQIPPIVLTVWAVGRWSAVYVGEGLHWIGQVILVPMLAATFDYFTFYDIAIVFFFTAGLLFLKKRQYTAFVVLLVIGTLNHENILLLVPIAFLETYPNRRLCASVCGSVLLGHFAVREALQTAFHLPHQLDIRFWTNLYFPFVYPKMLLISIFTLIFWWVAAASSWSLAEPFLRHAALLLPMLFVVTFIFGQFHEARQFDGLIPVVIAFLLLRIPHSSEVPAASPGLCQ